MSNGSIDRSLVNVISVNQVTRPSSAKMHAQALQFDNDTVNSQLKDSNKKFQNKDFINKDSSLTLVYIQLSVPFFGGVFEEGVKNFVTVWTLLDFSFVFLSSNLLKGVMVDCDWAF